MDPNGNGYDIPPAREPLDVTCAFLVTVTPDGQAVAWSDLSLPLNVQRIATLNEMYVGCAQVMRDIQNMMIAPMVAEAVLQGQMQMVGQVSDAQLTQKLTTRDLHQH